MPGSTRIKKYNIKKIVVQVYILFSQHVYYFPVSGQAVSRGHRCRPLSPPVLAFNFYRA